MTGTTAITDVKAAVSFQFITGDTTKYIERDTTYYIKEIKAPDGYKASDEVFTAVVDEDGKVTYGAAGSKEPPKCANIANDPEPEPPKPSVPSAPPVIRPTVTAVPSVPSGATTTTVKNTTTTAPAGSFVPSAFYCQLKGRDRFNYYKTCTIDISRDL